MVDHVSKFLVEGYEKVKMCAIIQCACEGVRHFELWCVPSHRHQWAVITPNENFNHEIYKQLKAIIRLSGLFF